MKSKCKTCGKNCEGEYCFVHKPRKKLSSKLDKKLDKSEMQEFFLRIWKKKLHYSQVSMDYLGSEPLTIFFHHILPKEKYPQAMYDEENIVLLTLEEHDNVERDMYKYEIVNKLREKLLKKYEN
jgi:sulfatase maturation enzyme AslB (radical SAM superfamily)